MGQFAAPFIAAAAGAALTSDWLSAQTSSVRSSTVTELDEITLDTLRRDLDNAKFTVRSLAEQYLSRVDAADRNGPGVNSVIETNPEALTIADEYGRELQF